MIRPESARIAELAGRFDDAVRLLPESAYVRGVWYQVAVIEANRARVFWHAGREDDARAAYTAMDAALLATRDAPLAVRGALNALSEVGPLLADARLSTLALAVLPPFPGFSLSGSCPRLRGDWLAAAERFEEAEQCYHQGLEVCQRERAPVEEGRCWLGLAALAERAGDHAQAVEHLDRAARLFGAHGAKLYLDQVLAKKGMLGA